MSELFVCTQTGREETPIRAHLLLDAQDPPRGGQDPLRGGSSGKEERGSFSIGLLQKSPNRPVMEQG